MSTWSHYSKIPILLLASALVLFAVYYVLTVHLKIGPEIAQKGNGQYPESDAELARIDTERRGTTTWSTTTTTITTGGATGKKLSKEELNRRLSRLSVSNLIDLDLPPGATDREVEQTFVKTSESTEIVCNVSARIGNEGDGGWNVCEMDQFLPKSPCLVYSFGINNDWSFDDGVVKKYKCLVRSFDPSMSVKDHWRNDKNVFIQDGLSGKDYIMPGNLWRMNTLKTIQRIFNDDERTIDYLKFDIEFSEWGVLNTSIRDGSLERVKQIAFEVHTQAGISASQLRFYLGLLSGLRQLGFYRWYAHRNPIAPSSKSSISGETVWCCHELAYLNVNYL